MYILQAENICKTYSSGKERISVLENTNLKIADGELTAIMGASGSGKTTLLHLLCGIDNADSGKIFIKGKEISSLSDHELSSFRKKRFGMIFQDFQLLESLNVKDNILVPLILNNCAIEEQESAYNRVIDALQIRHIEQRNLSEISGGQKQRVAIARAFIHNPSLIFADEPTGNLDAKTTKDVMEQILYMNRKFKTSVLIVTHDSFVASFCDRVLLLKDGGFVGEARKDSPGFKEQIASLSWKMGGM